MSDGRPSENSCLKSGLKKRKETTPILGSSLQTIKKKDVQEEATARGGGGGGDGREQFIVG